MNKIKLISNQNNIIYGILFFAAVLRLWGVQFGLPYLYHADEPIIVNHALAYGTFDFHPYFFKIPPLTSYLLFFVYGIYYVALRLFGVLQSSDEFFDLFLSDPTSFYLMGRIVLGVFLAVLTIYMLYRLVKKFFSLETGVLAAFFLSALFIHVRNSHFIYTDMLLLLVLVSSFYPILNILEKGERKDYLLFAVLFGTAVATKYNGVFLFIPFLLAHFIKQRVDLKSVFSFNLILVGVISIATFFLLSPFSLIDYKFFFNDIFGETGAGRWLGFTGAVHHLKHSLYGGVGAPFFILSFVAMLFLLFKKQTKLWVIFIFLISYYTVIALFGQPHDRYVLPLIPFLCILVSDFMIGFKNKFRVSRTVFCLLIFLVILPSIAKVVLSNQIFVRDDVRTEAKQWVESNVEPGSKIALGTSFFMPRLNLTVRELEEKKQQLIALGVKEGGQLKRMDHMIHLANKDLEPRYALFFLSQDLKESSFLFAQPKVPYNLEALKLLGIRYVLIERIHEGQDKAFYHELRENAVLVKRFSPYKDEKIQWAIDSQALTGGPFLWEELMARQKNGHTIEVYEL